jgi:hypothetical protein
MTHHVANLLAFCLLITMGCAHTQAPAANRMIDIRALYRDRDIAMADKALADEPITVTAAHSPYSAGGVHDFYSEADYFWPDPSNPDAPWISKDGLSNPEIFADHRHVMIRFSMDVAALTSAWRSTGDRKYATAAIKHIHAWFVDEQTRMNPNLEYAQAVRNLTPGRSYGIIDTVHLIEVAKSASLLEQAGLLKGDDLTQTKKWFQDYITWLKTSKNGMTEMNAANNHGTCWVEQVAAFASFTGDAESLSMCCERFETILLPNQLAPDGSFPQELRRTKPYGYSIFNADAMATICWILSTPQDNLWDFTLPDGRNMRKACDYIYPFIKDKSSWPKKPDVMFWEFWPVRSPVLLFGGLAYHDQAYLETWKTLEANPTNSEVIRNLPIRHPVLWVD